MAVHSRSVAEQFVYAVHSALSLADVGAAFLSTAGAVIKADVVGLYRFPGANRTPIDVLSDAESDFLQSYEEHGRSDDPVLDFVATHRRPTDSTRAAERSTWARSGACAVLAEAGLRQSLEAPLLVSGELIGTVNFARISADDKFDTDDLSSARMLGEQLSLAIERALRFELTKRRSAAMESALDRVAEGIVVSDIGAGILYANRAAREILDSSTDDRRQHAAELMNDAADALQSGSRVHSGSMRMADGTGHVVAKSWLQDERHGAVVTVLNHSSGSVHGDQPALSVLSTREREIARLVSDGLTSKQIAERAFISENTVKQHLKRIFAKTDVRNRAELVQLIWSSGVR
ncbi:LuxR C-terminal-related transcriptional regulator [Rhodococcus sp. MEB064]|uniref:LuxR C-terminal-related transcriptional regulator n=1 Tax=Rhodococcus sp. MEB064 TaxID=1587522 RepID=UPI0012DFFC27|nr:LuxR C-terminal-related transcriptional regulator [Rhodococcus sp. MEB064]